MVKVNAMALEHSSGPGFTGQRTAEIVNTAAETVNNDTFSRNPLRSASRREWRIMSLNDGLFHLPSTALAAEGPIYVGGIGIMTDDAHPGVVRAVVAMQAPNGVALIAVGDVHVVAPGYRAAVGDGKGLVHIGYRDAVRESAVAVKIAGRVPLDGHHSTAYGRAWQGTGR
jgi:hypothetical protein